MARKPLVGTVAANVLAHGTGALNIDGCRVEGTPQSGNQHAVTIYGSNGNRKPGPHAPGNKHGRWPANVILDEDAAAALDEQSGESRSPAKVTRGAGRQMAFGMGRQQDVPCFGDTGGASRFFYVAKPGRREREAGLDQLGEQHGGSYDGNDAARPGRKLGAEPDKPNAPRANIHPTVKPLTLMRYLCRLVAAPGTGAVILDPFLGSGTTGCAVAVENHDPEHAPGWSFIGIEADPEYMEIASARIAHWAAVGAASTDESSIAA